MSFTIDYVKQLWDEMPDKSWDGLKAVLEHRKNQSEGMGIEDTLAKVVGDIKESGREFPKSPEELYDVLRQHIGGVGEALDHLPKI